MERIVYLDTHVVIWLYAGDLKVFPQKTLNLLEASDLFISPIVKLELQYLLEIGRIKVKPDKILTTLSKSINLKIAEKDFDKIVNEAMTQTWTRDPFDRLIIAEAKIAKAPLITKDSTIRKHYKDSIWSK